MSVAGVEISPAINQQRLWELCAKFITDNTISGDECIYQCDRVIENAYEFIEKVCDIVGYHEYGDDE